MAKKLLTIEDLCNFFDSEGKNVVFDSKESNTSFIVSMPGKAVFQDDNTPKGLTKVHIKACHGGDNKNHFTIEDKVNKDALPSFKTRPILANIHELNDGSMSFKGHDWEDNDDGTRTYYEIPVGVTSSTEEPYMEYDANYDKTYVHVNGYIFDDYSYAKKIIEDEGGVSDVSMEIDIESLSYDAVSKNLSIQKYTCLGITCLGKEDDGTEINPAMVGANISLVDFSNKEQFSTKEFAETVDKLQKMLTAFSIESQKKGGKPGMNKFEELLAKYDKTAEDITFEYENMSDEELEAKFAEVFDDSGDGGDPTSEPDNGDDEEPEGEAEPEGATDEGTNSTESEPVLGASGNTEDTGNSDISGKKKIYSITDPSGKTFSVSLNDKIGAVSQLVNATYADEDNDYYFCTVYDDSVVMESWCTGKLYKQSYTDENGTFSLTGERVEVFTEYLTAEEQNTLKVIRGEYAELKEYKESNEAAKATAAKDEVFAKFSEILAGNTEFEELKKGEFSAEELELRCNALVGKKQMATFAAHDENKAHKVLFDFNGKTEEKKPYGGLFDDEK